MFGNINVNKTVYSFLVSLKYRDIITSKTITLYKKLFFTKSLIQEMNLAIISSYNVSQEIWLGNSKKLIYIDQSRLYIFSHPREFENV